VGRSCQRRAVLEDASRSDATWPCRAGNMLACCADQLLRARPIASAERGAKVTFPRSVDPRSAIAPISSTQSLRRAASVSVGTWAVARSRRGRRLNGLQRGSWACKLATPVTANLLRQCPIHRMYERSVATFRDQVARRSSLDRQDLKFGCEPITPPQNWRSASQERVPRSPS
jgi:hypothetical protein